MRFQKQGTWCITSGSKFMAASVALLFWSSDIRSIAQEAMTFDHGCSYSGGPFDDKRSYWTFASDTEARSALAKVMEQVGLPANFYILAADVSNAEAVIRGSDRYILYNQLFMESVESATGTNWASVSILSHEIGHHLSGHTLDHVGSRPDKELEADRFSGFVLFKMGATLDQALAAMRKIASEQGSVTHPGKSARLAAITNGWKAAKDLAGGIGNVENTKPVEPKPVETAASGRFNQIWVEHNVIENGFKGMRVHCAFDIHNWKDKEGFLGVYFYFENGTKLKDFNGLYTSSDGQVSHGENFYPNYTNTTFSDFKLFIPYDELHMKAGKYDLKLSAELFKKVANNYSSLGKSDTVHFNYSSGF